MQDPNKTQISSPEDDSYDERINRELVNKVVAYHQRFGESYQIEDGFLLPMDICLKELDRAKILLSDKDKKTEAKMVPYDRIPNSIGAFEIKTSGRRFSIPRDNYCIIDGIDAIEVSSAVVSIDSIETWPIWLKNVTSPGSSGDVLPFEVTPKILKALREIDESTLVDDAMDLAVHLQLGDRVTYQKKDMLERELLGRAMKKFGINDINLLKTILSTIGLGIIKTSDRLSDSAESPDSTSKTEVDALLEAIQKNA